MLPIDSLIPGILDSLRVERNLVIEAAPGAGKTTRVPPALLAFDGDVLVLEPRGVDYPLSRFALATVKRTTALLGSTLESMQVYDILRGVDYLSSADGLRPRFISVFGRKQMGARGIYAALLDSRITRVIVDDPPATHWQGPALLNVLRFTDLPETAAMVAPREIVSLTPLPVSWSYTSRIYALYGKPQAIREAHGMAQATRISQRGRDEE